MQTSLVTVAVLELDKPSKVVIRESDIEIDTARGSGPGGQKRNKTESCIIATHKPSGLVVRIDNERSQHQNRALAIRMLRARLAELEQNRQTQERNDLRRQQVGLGMRGAKIRTYRERDNLVINHRTGEKKRFDKWMRGEW